MALKICVRQDDAEISHLCIKFKSVRNRPAVVRYREHWNKRAYVGSRHIKGTKERYY